METIVVILAIPFVLLIVVGLAMARAAAKGDRQAEAIRVETRSRRETKLIQEIEEYLRQQV